MRQHLQGFRPRLRLVDHFARARENVDFNTLEKE
jgi:hypothetical protein